VISWQQSLRSNGVDCQGCTEAYRGDPPCDECGKTEPLTGNRLAVQAWEALDAFERVDGRLSLTAMSMGVKIWGGDFEDLQKLIRIETEMLLFYQQRTENAGDKT